MNGGIVGIILFGILAAGGIVPLLGYAQEPGPLVCLSLSETVRLAIQASEDLHMQQNECARKQSAVREEQSYLFPHFSGELNWLNNFKYPDIPATSLTEDYHLEAGISVSQTVFTFGRISSAVAAAKQAVAASLFIREKTEREIVYNAKSAFYTGYFSQRILTVFEESYYNSLRNKEMLEELVSAGRASKLDNIRMAADVAARIPSVANARADSLSSMEALKTLIGAAPGVSLELTGVWEQDYPEMERKNLTELLLARHPALKALERKVAEKNLLISSYRSALFPEFSAFCNWTHKGDGGAYYVGGERLNDYGVAGLKVSVPIWQGGAAGERLYQARVNQDDARLQYKQGRENYLLALDTAINEYREYKNSLAADTQAVSLAREAFNYSRELFAAGRISVRDLNDAELQLTKVKAGRELTVLHLNLRLALIEKLSSGESGDE